MSDVLNSYGALQQVVMKPTRKDEILDIILTDLHTSYHAPLPLPPLQVDDDQVGKDSDHRIILFPPIPHEYSNTKREYNFIKVRPLPQCNIEKMGMVIGRYPWTEVFNVNTAEEKVTNFHETILTFLNIFFRKKC